MTRQCLYCGKELPKTTASNFCSKECWTEYKKVKAMNVDADKQATVLLKKVDIPPQTESQPEEIPLETAQEPFVETSELMERMNTYEALIQDRLSDMDETIRSLASNMADTAAVEPGHIESSEEVINRLSILEEKLENAEPATLPDEQIEERISALEKRIRQISSSEPRRKKGFFARLFT